MESLMLSPKLAKFLTTKPQVSAPSRDWPFPEQAGFMKVLDLLWGQICSEPHLSPDLFIFPQL